MPYPGLLHPEPLPLRQATADPHLHRRPSDTVLTQSLWAGHEFCALLRSEQLHQPGTWQVLSPQVGWGILSPTLSQPLGFLGAQQERCLRCAMRLLWGADLWLQPSWWMSTVQDPRKPWLATGSLLAVW